MPKPRSGATGNVRRRRNQDYDESVELVADAGAGLHARCVIFSLKPLVGADQERMSDLLPIRDTLDEVMVTTVHTVDPHVYLVGGDAEDMHTEELAYGDVGVYLWEEEDGIYG
jgi:hypothetical protein